MTKEEAIELLDDIKFTNSDYPRDVEALEMAIKALEQPEQKKGKWIVTGSFDDFLKCSCCKYMKPWNEDIFNFCPHCGAEMEEQDGRFNQ